MTNGNDISALGYIDPYTKGPLSEVDGELHSSDGNAYKIVTAYGKSIPIFLDASRLGEDGERSLTMYDTSQSVEIYRNFLSWLFRTFDENEGEFRRALVSKLNLRAGDKILITGCGLGDDVFPVVECLGGDCSVYASDLSLHMVTSAAQDMEARFRNSPVKLNFFVADAGALPFDDNFFDSAFHFGGINLFDDPKTAIAEMTRVVRDGGRIAFGDEGVAPWLRHTEYAKMVIANNYLWAANSLIDILPFGATEVNLSWILGNCFYFIDYTKSAKGPHINPDIQHIGWKGGSMRTRYFGQVEGVSPDLKNKMYEAAKKNQVSVHDWLNAAIKDALSK